MPAVDGEPTGAGEGPDGVTGVAAVDARRGALADGFRDGAHQILRDLAGDRQNREILPHQGGEVLVAAAQIVDAMMAH